MARDLAELYLSSGRPSPLSLVFPARKGGNLRRHNWRARVWMPALERAGIDYFRPYDLRHTCATLLIYEGRTPNEVAGHLGHADAGFTLRTYTHVFSDAAERRFVPIEEAILKARARMVRTSPPRHLLAVASEEEKNPANNR